LPPPSAPASHKELIMPRARVGRKRLTNVVRFPSGQIKRSEPALIMPYNCNNVIKLGDGKLGNKIKLQRQTVLEQLVLDPSERAAGWGFAELRERCRQYAWDAPAINPKAANLQPSHGHNGDKELTEDDIKKGKDYHKRYMTALGALRRGSRGVVSAINAVCLENKEPTPDQRGPLREGLGILVRLWGL
jgi:hypothetical protein